MCLVLIVFKVGIFKYKLINFWLIFFNVIVVYYNLEMRVWCKCEV